MLLIWRRVLREQQRDKIKVENLRESVFESIKKINEHGQEYWSARNLAKIIEYSEYRHFLPTIERAKEACKNSANQITDHIENILDMVEIGSGATRSIPDLQLSRYACYLIVQNADPSKEVVSLGQTNFAYQTRKQEISELEAYKNLRTDDEKRLYLRNEMKGHNLKLAAAAKDVGIIEPIDYAIFQDHGYKGLYGGLGAKDIHKRKS